MFAIVDLFYCCVKEKDHVLLGETVNWTIKCPGILARRQFPI